LSAKEGVATASQIATPKRRFRPEIMLVSLLFRGKCPN
jgi:hypothetical protein